MDAFHGGFAARARNVPGGLAEALKYQSQSKLSDEPCKNCIPSRRIFPTGNKSRSGRARNKIASTVRTGL
ncbi:protein of unknown function [Bradyrhizobium vignae]|uniref:Uncharacterized protein n=1 Tax=Bradyrhizobium vignae TaxID=1549949 RepID=A0A2U3PTB4_9BRAD|nr:protein of unknown function [Bradyrhizobium vignae]